MYILFLVSCLRAATEVTCLSDTEAVHESVFVEETSIEADSTSETGLPFEEFASPVAVCEFSSSYLSLPEDMLSLDGGHSYDPAGFPLHYEWSFDQFPGGIEPLVYSPDAPFTTVSLFGLGDYAASLHVWTFDEREGFCSVQFHVTTSYDLWFQVRTVPDANLSVSFWGPTPYVPVSSGVAVPLASNGNYTLAIVPGWIGPTDVVVDIYAHGIFLDQVYKPNALGIENIVLKVAWPSLVITK